jgi:hypothetical protein
MVGGNFYRDKNWQPPFVFKSSIILAQAWSVERILIAVQDLIGLANGFTIGAPELPPWI